MLKFGSIQTKHVPAAPGNSFELKKQPDYPDVSAVVGPIAMIVLRG